LVGIVDGRDVLVMATTNVIVDQLNTTITPSTAAQPTSLRREPDLAQRSAVGRCSRRAIPRRSINYLAKHRRAEPGRVAGRSEACRYP